MPIQPIVLPIAPYAPDLPDYPAPGSNNILNVVPRTAASYGPIGAPSVVSGALGHRCQGAAAFIDKNGIISLFAGDSTKLYIQQAGSSAWADVSGAGYTIDSNDQWEFDVFNGKVIATDYTDAMQVYDLGAGGTFGDLAAAAPKARTISVVKNAFLVAGNTSDASNGALDQRVWWSAAGDATNWPMLGSTAAAQVQSGATDLLGNMGPIRAIRAGLSSADAVVIQAYGVKRMMYAGPPQVFDFLPAENLRGTPAEHSPVVYGGNVYFLGWDGFYAFDGAQSRAIGADKVDKTFFADLDPSLFNRVVGAVDPLNKLIIWAYPGQNHDANGNPNKLIIYNWQLDSWSLAEITSETICRMFGLGYTLDQLWTILGYTLETLPASLDSSVWQDGKLQFGLFDTSHQLNYLSGPPMAATIDTSEMQPFPGRRTKIKAARPLVDGGTPSIAIKHRETQQAMLTSTDSIAINSLGSAGVRTSGRYIRASTTIPAGTAWTGFAGVELDALPGGTR